MPLSQQEKNENWQRIRRLFLTRLADDRLTLDRLIGQLQDHDATASQLEQIRALSHQLAGSGATFGFAEITDEARLVEQRVLQSVPPADELVRMLDALADALSAALSRQAGETPADVIAPAPFQPASETSDRERVLIAEDDVILADMIRSMLGEMVDVDTVADGAQVIEAIDRVKPAIVLLDDGLPNLSGLDIIESLGRGSETSVIMLTANDAPESVLRAVRAGAVDYLVKPVDPVALARAVRDKLKNVRHRVLVIDDDVMVRQLLSDRFRSAGYRVTEAPDGITGLDLARAAPPDIIVLDRMMPGLEGSAILHQIHADASLRAIPVIVLTAKADADDAMHFLRRGAAEFMTKPFNPEEVVLRADRLIERRRDD